MSTRRETVLIVGYGEMGHAMQSLLQARHEVVIWNRHPVAGLAPVDLEATAARAGIVIFCIPVLALAEMAARILPHLAGTALAVILSKGLDAQGRTAPQLMRDVGRGRAPCAALYGPMIAEELSAGRPGFAQLAAGSAAAVARCRALFDGSRLYLRPSSDATGIAWASVLKNVYAILSGAVDALGLGKNVRGYLIVSAVEEMCRIVQVLGGAADTCLQLAGLGDLVTTATSADSHHHALGVQLARGEPGPLTGEGIHTLQVITEQGLFRRRDYPLFDLVCALVDDPVDVERRIRAFLAQQFRGAPA